MTLEPKLLDDLLAVSCNVEKQGNNMELLKQKKQKKGVETFQPYLLGPAVQVWSEPLQNILPLPQSWKASHG